MEEKQENAPLKTRQDRLAQAMRANLRKRKEQAQLREQSQQEQE